MSDTLWHDRLADLARGRERLRRRRVGHAGVAVLVVAVLAGGALLTGGTGPRAETPPAATVPPVPTAIDTRTPGPSVVESAVPPPPSSTPTMPRRYAWIRHILERSDGPRSPFPQWRDRIFLTTASVLDPSGGHLSYANQGITGGWDEHGISMGIKMGWSQPGGSGEGLVQVGISSQEGADDALCRITAGFSCPRAVRVGGRTGHLGEYQGSYVVAFGRPDGERVVVLVDKKFGNESAQGVDRLGFTRDDVYRLVQDDRLGLPRR